MRVYNDFYEKIIANLHDGLFFVDQNKIITYWNKEAERITGYTHQEVIGNPYTKVIPHCDKDDNFICSDDCPLYQTLTDGKPRDKDLYISNKNGEKLPVSVRISSTKDNYNKITGAIELFSDISGKTVNELRIKELEKLALLDNLTKLANRHYIQKELKSRFEENKRFSIPFGILFIDIDDFKSFNDNFGHINGDKILKNISNTFISNSRAFDLFGRWGGEEFIGIIRNINGDNLYNLGEKLRILIEKNTLKINGRKICITISLGATLVKPGDTIDSLIDRADKLLYRSKTAGKNRITSD